MPDLVSGVRVLTFSEPRLSAAAVARITCALREQQDAAPVILDCAALAEVDPDGLSALLELGRCSTGMQEVALAGLSRSLTRTAVQAGLSERFDIYTSTEAALRDRQVEPARALPTEPAPCEP